VEGDLRKAFQNPNNFAKLPSPAEADFDAMPFFLLP